MVEILKQFTLKKTRALGIDARGKSLTCSNDCMIGSLDILQKNTIKWGQFAISCPSGILELFHRL